MKTELTGRPPFRLPRWQVVSITLQKTSSEKREYLLQLVATAPLVATSVFGIASLYYVGLHGISRGAVGAGILRFKFFQVVVEMLVNFENHTLQVVYFYSFLWELFVFEYVFAAGRL